MRIAPPTRENDRRLGYLRLTLVCATTAGLIGLGMSVAYVNRPAVGQPCSVPNTTARDTVGRTMSCQPALTGSREAVWQHVAAG